MKSFKKLISGILCLSLGVFSMVSCVDDDPDPLNAVVDVIIRDVKTDTGVKYAITVYATANYNIKSAKITAPGTGGKVYQLTASSDKRQFVYIPQASDFTTDMPVKGDYSFEIISEDNQTITGKDVVGDEKLSPIAIKTATMSSQKLKTTWDKITGADAYVVRLYSADKSEILFASSFLAADKVDYEFGASTSGWATGKSPVANTNYVVELIGLKVETGITLNQSSNFQFFTYDSKTIKWE